MVCNDTSINYGQIISDEKMVVNSTIVTVIASRLTMTNHAVVTRITTNKFMQSLLLQTMESLTEAKNHKMIVVIAL